MHEIITLLLGALIVFTGGYIWWTHRRFKRYQKLLHEIITRTARADALADTSSRIIADFSEQIGTLRREVTFLLENRVVPPDNGPNINGRQMTARERDKTAWDHLNERIDEL